MKKEKSVTLYSKLKKAVTFNQIEEVKLIVKEIEQEKIKINTSRLLIIASSSGFFDIVKLLCEYTDPELCFNECESIFISYNLGFFDIVYYLISFDNVLSILEIEQPVIYNDIKKMLIKEKVETF